MVRVFEACIIQKYFKSSYIAGTKLSQWVMQRRWMALGGIINIMPKLGSQYRQEQDESDEEMSATRRSKKEAPPRFVKNGIHDLDIDTIVVNLSKTHYDIIETVVEELGWTAQHSKKSQKWDILWTDWHIEAQDLFRLNDQQKISHFPAIYVLAKKNFLGRSLMKMSKVFPEEYNFFPSTWSVPAELGELMRHDAQQTEAQAVYIFKPEASSQGKGIVLFTKLEELQGKNGIVQLYVNNPLLIDGLKFDMRIYVLIYGCDPLRIYIYEEGLARFATEHYEKARKKNLKDNFIHLTNYAINKTSKKFVFNTSQHNMNVGHKRSLTAVFTLLTSKGYNVQQIKQKIDQLVVKTLLVGKPMLEHMVGLSQTDNLANDHCFQILGFDVLINDKLQPILLEVNHTPSFATDTPLDKNIKKNLIKETLLLLNVNTQTKKARIEKKLQFQERRAQRKVVKLTQEEKKEMKRQIQREKDQYQAATLKKFRRLYPLEDNQYAEMEDYACKIFNEQSGFKNKEVTSLKNSLNMRPTSLENLPAPKKIKKGADLSTSQKYAPSRMIEQQLLEKLPNISPNRAAFLNSPALNPSRVVLKNYQFSPDKAFANLTDKYARKLRHNQKIVDGSLIFAERQRSSELRREGAFVEPKIMRLNQLACKTPVNLQELAADYSVSYKQRNSRRTFLDFISLTNRQKNALQHDKRKAKRLKNGLMMDQ